MNSHKSGPQGLTIPLSKFKLLTTQYHRIKSKKIQRLASQFPVVVITGARQVGKTTLLRSLFPNYHYVSLDLPSYAEAAETEPQLFLERNPSPLIVDEVQYAPKIFRNLKARVDQDRHKMGHYILTGSQKFPLMKGVAESLAGRVGIVELETFSLAEIGAKKHWIPLLIRGMYPELWRQPEMRASDFYFSYLSTYLERDVRQILNVPHLRTFERFLRASALRSGQLLNRSDFTREVGVALKTIGEWIGVFQESHQICLLEPYFENLGKRLIKSPKLYWHDTGLLCFLLGLDENSLPQSPLLGAIWETFVCAELRKRVASHHHSSGQPLWFYRDAQGQEADFLEILQGRLDLYECKFAENPSLRRPFGGVEVLKSVQERLERVAFISQVVCR